MKMGMKRLVSLLCVLALALSFVPMALAAGEEDYVHNFTTAGKTSGFYTITGNLSTGKGTVSYDGKTLTQCLKMESATNIKFTAPGGGGTLIFVLAEAAGTIKVDGAKYTASNGVITVSVDAGAHEITKADTANLFYMIFAAAGVPQHTHTFGSYEVTKAPTCTATGEETAQCTYPGCTETNVRSVATIDHTYAEGGVFCTECGHNKNGGADHLTHTFGNWTVSEGKEASCTQEGEEQRVCSNTECGKVETRPVPKTPHSYVNGVCEVCREPKPEGKFTKVGGHLESAYAQWNYLSGANAYRAYVKKTGENDSAYKPVDDQLIRQYPGFMRLDVVGLAAGSYVLKVEALSGGAVQTSMTTDPITVLTHDRTGFAHFKGTSSGAYNENGTLRSDASVIYVTEQTKNTVEWNGFTGLQNILNAQKKNATGTLCVRFIGNITDPAVLEKGDLLVDGVTCGLTLEGIGNDAVANGWGIRIKGSSNVEVRNLGFMNCDSGEGDCLGLQQDNEYVWAHNNDFFYGDAGSDADQAKGDGSLDTKKSTYVTHSYNHFWDSGKCNLQGMKSEKNTNYITYHHNWYDHSDSRHPRIRTCTVHIYNNYFDGNAKYGVGMTMGGSAFVESNYFRNVSKPMMISCQGTDAAGEGTFSGEAGGVIKSFGNKMVMENRTLIYKTQKDSTTDFDAYETSSRSETVPASIKAKSGGTTYNNFDTNSSLMYACTPDDPDTAMQKVQQYAGRVEGGDFQWFFNNATEDTNYAVIAQLKTALTNYKTTLVKVGGTVSGSTPSTPSAHTHSWRWSVTTAATCTESGVRTATCLGCTETQTETIPATGHTFVNGTCTGCGGSQGSVPDPTPTPGGDTTSTYILTGNDVFSKLTPNGQDSNSKRDLYNCAAYEVLSKQGTNGFFTIYAGADKSDGTPGTKIDYSSQTISDYSGTYRINFNGGAKVTGGTPGDVIGFTTTGPATVKVWAVGGSNDADGRYMVILDASGNEVTRGTTKFTTSSQKAVETLSLPAAGTYYLGGSPKKNNIFKVEVVVTAAMVEPDPEPDVDCSGFLEGTQRDLKWYYTEAQELTVNEMEQSDTVLAACYDDQGRLTGVKVITPAKNTAEIDNDTPMVKLFWVDTQNEPMCPSETAWGDEE